MSTYSVKVQYFVNNGKSTVKVIEQHILEAVSVTDAETKMASYMEKAEIADYKLTSCSEYKLTDALVDPRDDDNKWWAVKVCYEMINEKGKVQKTYENNLIFTENINRAYKIMEQVLSGTSLQWGIESISKTVVCSVDQEKVKEILLDSGK